MVPHSVLSFTGLLILFAETSAFLSPSSLLKDFSSATIANPNKNKPHSSSVVVDQDVVAPLPKKRGHKVPTINDEDLPSRSAQSRKRWGIDKSQEDEYWFDQRIHSIGNIGLGGCLHALVAPMATRRIDQVAYGGVDMRLSVAQELNNLVKTQKARVLDMCCGVGMSTRALRRAFPDAEQVLGVDTSPQMINMAKVYTGHLRMVMPWLQRLRELVKSTYQRVREHGKHWEEKTCHAFAFQNLNFINANAQDTKLPSKSFDLVTVMYAFHEAPHKGRFSIAQEARRLLSPGGLLAIIDITTDYTPSEAMLQGEPYVVEYQKNIHQQLRSMKGFTFQGYKVLVPGHVGMWTLKR